MKQQIPYRKSIGFKFSFVLICAALLIILTILFLSAGRNQHNGVIYQDRKTERQQSFQVIADLKDQKLRGLTIETTYYDDLVNFIADPSSKISKAFENDAFRAQLDSYGANAIWTYNKQYKLVSNTNTFDKAHAQFNLGLSPADISAMFKKDYYVNFYRQTDQGVFEIFGATVHGSSDPEHKTPNEGYFFISHKLDSAYISDLQKLTKDSVAIENVSDMAKKTQNREASTGIITFYQALSDENNKPIARLKVDYNSAAIAGLFQSNNLQINTAIGLYILLAIAVYFLLRIIIISPITVIYESLMSGKTETLGQLAAKDTELGRIADLIKQAEEQKAELANLATEAQIAREDLITRTTELESINSVMVDRELRMVELKRQNEELKKNAKDS